MSVFKNLKALHDKFRFPRREKPQLLNYDFMKFRMNFIVEELEETKKAYQEKDTAEVIDGLIDIAYVAIGTLDLMGVDGQAHWNEVQRANMEKEVVNDHNKSKRGFKLDLEKPEGWTGPDHISLLENHYDK